MRAWCYSARRTGEGHWWWSTPPFTSRRATTRRPLGQVVREKLANAHHAPTSPRAVRGVRTGGGPWRADRDGRTTEAARFAGPSRRGGSGADAAYGRDGRAHSASSVWRGRPCGPSSRHQAVAGMLREAAGRAAAVTVRGWRPPAGAISHCSAPCATRAAAHAAGTVVGIRRPGASWSATHARADSET